ncbi:MAG: O-antigen ligase family protein [Solirubrobacterales bacterium]
MLCAAAALLLLLGPSARYPPWPRSAVVALVALAALGIWSALSAVWSPSPDIAIADGQRILMYALSFGLGAWMARQLGPRVLLALAPLAAAAAFAGVAAVVEMLTASDPEGVIDNGTLLYPIGYRNANAAFFLIAFFPALGLAADRELDWRARGLCLGTATMSLELAMLGQSRGSVPAVAVAIVVYVLLSPLKVRAISWLVLAVLPAVVVLPAVLELFDVANADPEVDRRVLAELEDAARVVALTAGAAFALGLVAARLERRLPILGSTSARWNRPIAGGLAALLVAGVTGFAVVNGDPAGWVSDRVDEFRYAGTPEPSGLSSRFTLDVGSNRYDLWRVALDDAAEEPVLGDGGGGFQYSYLRQRESPRQARDAHSVELEVLSELGFPGLLMLLATLTCAVAAALRARRAGPAAATLTAIALASAAYWLVHASVDWFWTYAGLTAPTLALLGAAAAAPGPAPGAGGGSRLARGLAATALAVLALTAIPPLLSAKYIDGAFESWRSDIETSYEDLERAHDLNPLSDIPFLAAGAIARAAGDRARAVAAFDRAVEERPEEFTGHFLLALLQSESEPRVARREAARALELNPLDERVRGLAERLGLRVPDLD